MKAQRSLSVILVISALMVSVGCMPKMTIDEMKEMMPQRPAELDQLDVFAGSWEFTGEAKITGIDKPIPTTGTNEIRWDESRWFLTGNGWFRMEGFDEMRMQDTWAYDSHKKIYRQTWTDSMGSTGIGTGKYNAKDNTWTMRATSYGPHGKTTGKGCMKLVDNNTMEWSWAEYVMGGLVKTMEMTGTSTRQ